MTHALVVRAQAGPGIGAGHFLRGLALAQRHAARGGRVLVLTNPEAQPLWGRLDPATMEARATTEAPGSPADAASIARAANEVGARWVACDGYCFGAPFHAGLRRAGLRVLAVDDHGLAGSWDCDIVVDQNAGAGERDYARRAPGTRLLLGPAYALLRREFLRDLPRPLAPQGSRVLVTLGGADPGNVTAKALRGLVRANLPLEVDVAVGVFHPARGELEAFARGAPFPVRLHLDTRDMPRLIAQADLVIGAGGSTSWEVAHAGVPLLLLPTTDNQVPVAQALAHEGAARDLGWHGAVEEADVARAVETLLQDPGTRASLSRQGRRLVDGRGAARVLAAMGAADLALRRASMDDARMLWQWANDPAVRENSFNPQPIAWEGHLHWLAGKLADPACLFLVGESDGQPIGQVRFDVAEGIGILGVAVAPQRRGQGLGAALLDAATMELFRSGQARLARGVVKASNQASREAFLAAGFQAVQSEGIYAGGPVVAFERHRELVPGRE